MHAKERMSEYIRYYSVKKEVRICLVSDRLRQFKVLDMHVCVQSGMLEISCSTFYYFHSKKSHKLIFTFAFVLLKHPCVLHTSEVARFSTFVSKLEMCFISSI